LPGIPAGGILFFGREQLLALSIFLLLRRASKELSRAAEAYKVKRSR
jgi:hypothetical protein